MPNNIIEINKLDNDAIKANLISFLKNQSKFQDFNFEGSSINILLDLLSHTTTYMGHYAWMLNNETHIDSAYLKSSLQSRAKLVNYLPGSKSASTAIVKFKVAVDQTNDPSERTFVVPRGTSVKSNTNSSDNRTFILIDDLHIFNLSNDINVYDYTSPEVNVYEGSFEEYKFLVDNTLINQKFTITDENVDIKTLSVRVFDTDISTNFETYKLVDDYMTVDKDSKVFFLTTNADGYYDIQFGNDVYGKSLSTGNLIECSYISTSGEAGNNSKNFIFGQSLSVYNNQYNVDVETVDISSGGLDNESLEELRFNIPNHFRQQNRAVVVDDYKGILLTNYKNINSINVWGGEDNEPPEYGKVFISIKPKFGNVLSSRVKTKLKDLLNRKAIKGLVDIEIIDPEIININVGVNLIYNQLSTVKTQGQIRSEVISAVNDYNTNTLNKFGSLYSNLSLNTVVKETNTAIASSYSELELQKDTTIDFNNTQTYNISFYNKVVPGSLRTSKFNFRFVDSWITDDGNGNLLIWYYNADQGKDVFYENETFGTIDYETGQMAILDFRPTSLVDTTDKLDIMVKPVSPDFYSQRNNIVNINNITVTINDTFNQNT